LFRSFFHRCVHTVGDRQLVHRLVIGPKDQQVLIVGADPTGHVGQLSPPFGGGIDNCSGQFLECLLLFQGVGGVGFHGDVRFLSGGKYGVFTTAPWGQGVPGPSSSPSVRGTHPRRRPRTQKSSGRCRAWRRKSHNSPRFRWTRGHEWDRGGSRWRLCPCPVGALISSYGRPSLVLTPVRLSIF